MDQLLAMNMADLRRLAADALGADHRISSPVLLRRKLAWSSQAGQDGDLPDSARHRALAIARDVDLRIHAASASHRKQKLGSAAAVTSTVVASHDSRLPLPGSLLIKEFKGQTLVVRVGSDGFEYDGRRYSSLSAIAIEITGTKWNGYTFFGLNKESAHAR